MGFLLGISAAKRYVAIDQLLKNSASHINSLQCVLQVLNGRFDVQNNETAPSRRMFRSRHGFLGPNSSDFRNRSSLSREQPLVIPLSYRSS